jgi:tetratricopeptide (TPR) repeat protein
MNFQVKLSYYRLAEIIANIYSKAVGSTYLLDKAAIFQQWNKEEKQNYQNAEKIYRDGEGARKEYNYNAAFDCYNKSFTLYREVGYKVGEANCLQSLGDVHLRLADYEKAGQQYDQALSIYKEINGRLGMLWSYYRLGQTFESVKNYPHAEQNYLECIDMLEEIWNLMKTEDIKTLYMGSNIFPYETILNLLFTGEIGPDAFPYAELSKARSFLYLLGNKPVNPQKGLPLKLVRAEEELRQKMALLSMKKRGGAKALIKTGAR